MRLSRHLIGTISEMNYTMLTVKQTDTYPNEIEEITLGFPPTPEEIRDYVNQRAKITIVDDKATEIILI